MHIDHLKLIDHLCMHIDHPKLAFPLSSQCGPCRVTSSIHDNGSTIIHWNITATLGYLLGFHGTSVRAQTPRGSFHPRTVKLMRHELSTLDPQVGSNYSADLFFC